MAIRKVLSLSPVAEIPGGKAEYSKGGVDYVKEHDVEFNFPPPINGQYSCHHTELINGQWKGFSIDPATQQVTAVHDGVVQKPLGKDRVIVQWSDAKTADEKLTEDKWTKKVK